MHWKGCGWIPPHASPVGSLGIRFLGWARVISILRCEVRIWFDLSVDRSVCIPSVSLPISLLRGARDYKVEIVYSTASEAIYRMIAAAKATCDALTLHSPELFHQYAYCSYTPIYFTSKYRRAAVRFCIVLRAVLYGARLKSVVHHAHAHPPIPRCASMYIYSNDNMCNDEGIARAGVHASRRMDIIGAGGPFV